MIRKDDPVLVIVLNFANNQPGNNRCKQMQIDVSSSPLRLVTMAHMVRLRSSTASHSWVGGRRSPLARKTGEVVTLDALVATSSQTQVHRWPPITDIANNWRVFSRGDSVQLSGTCVSQFFGWIAATDFSSVNLMNSWRMKRQSCARCFRSGNWCYTSRKTLAANLQGEKLELRGIR